MLHAQQKIVFGQVDHWYDCRTSEIVWLLLRQKAAFAAADLLSQAEIWWNGWPPVSWHRNENLAHESFARSGQATENFITHLHNRESLPNLGYSHYIPILMAVNWPMLHGASGIMVESGWYFREGAQCRSCFSGALLHRRLWDYMAGTNHILARRSTARFFLLRWEVYDFVSNGWVSFIFHRALAKLRSKTAHFARMWKAHAHGQFG